jgi:hypothetical protein
MRRRMMLIMFRRRGRILIMLLVRFLSLEVKLRENGGLTANSKIGGYKATLKNPNVSDEAKQHAKECLEELEIMS